MIAIYPYDLALFIFVCSIFKFYKTELYYTSLSLKLLIRLLKFTNSHHHYEILIDRPRKVLA